MLLFAPTIEVERPTQEQVEDTIKNGKPKQQAALYLRHTTAKFLLRDGLKNPILNEEQAAALKELLQEPDAYKQYLALYRKGRVFERCLDLVGRRMMNAEVSLTRLREMLIRLDQVEAAEEIANTLLDHHTREEREKMVEFISQTIHFHSCSIKTDAEGYMEVDASHDWRPQPRLSLLDCIKRDSYITQSRITSFFSCSAGLRQMINSVRFPLRDLYLKTLEAYENGIKEERCAGFKHDYSASKETARRNFGKEPYMEARREALLRDEDYFSFIYEPDKEEQKNWYEQFMDDWQDLTGRQY